MFGVSWIVACASLNAWLGPSRTRSSRTSDDFDRRAVSFAATHGFSFAVFGGFRALAADIIWLRAYVAWENREPVRTETLVELATTLDDRPLSFWLNGARIIAYDIPGWQACQSVPEVSALEQKRVSDQQARHALVLLKRAMTFHPASADLWIECGNIELYRLHEVAAAAECYRRAALHPDAPYHAGRVHAELLRRLGRHAEALDWLKSWHPQLPKNVTAAAADLVLARIRTLESELGIDLAHRYAPIN